MSKPVRTLFVLIMGIFTVVLGSFAAAWAMGSNDIVMSKRIEKVCFREIKNRSPLGHREIQTSRYLLEGSYVGVARGSMKTEISPNNWTGINWMCRVDREKGSILRVEFSRSTGRSRLLAAVSSF